MTTQPPDRRPRPWADAAWQQVRRHGPLRTAVDVVQYGVAAVLLILAAIVLVRSFVDFIDSPGGYPQTLVSAVDGVLVVIILVDILRTVLTHLQGWGFPFRPFLVIGIIAGVRDILAVTTRLTITSSAASSPFVVQSLFQLGTSAGVVLVLAVALWITRDQRVVEEDAAPPVAPQPRAGAG